MSSLSRLAAIATVALVTALPAPGCDGDGGDPATDTFPEAGQPYPAAQVSTCDGAPVALADWIAAHDVAFITFGAKWCQSCQEEAPVINAELVDALAGHNVGVAQILIEADPGDPPPQSLCAVWRDELGARFDVYVDVAQESLAPHFGGAVATLPLHYIVTGDGTVRLRKLGALPTDIQQLVRDWLP